MGGESWYTTFKPHSHISLLVMQIICLLTYMYYCNPNLVSSAFLCNPFIFCTRLAAFSNYSSYIFSYKQG